VKFSPFFNKSIILNDPNRNEFFSQIYYALRLSCSIDRLIFKMRVEDSSPIITNRKWNSEYSLDDNGEIREFLELDSLSEGKVEEMILVLLDTIKLVTFHSQKTNPEDPNLWSDKLITAWKTFLKILMEELKDS